MQVNCVNLVNFGKFVPVKVYLDDQLLDFNDAKDKKKIENITTLLCRNLRKDENSDNTFMSEQQRRFFGAMVKDYKPIVGKNKFYVAEKNKSSNVTTVNVKDVGRFLLTGGDIELRDKLGAEFCTSTNTTETAAARRQSELSRSAQNNKLGKTLNISAKSTITDKKNPTFGEMYRINYIDFLA